VFSSVGATGDWQQVVFLDFSGRKYLNLQ